VHRTGHRQGRVGYLERYQVPTPDSAGDEGCYPLHSAGIGCRVVHGEDEDVFPTADKGEPGLRSRTGVDPVEKGMSEGFLCVVRLDHGEEGARGNCRELLPAGDRRTDEPATQHGLSRKGCTHCRKEPFFVQSPIDNDHEVDHLVPHGGEEKVPLVVDRSPIGLGVKISGFSGHSFPRAEQEGIWQYFRCRRYLLERYEKRVIPWRGRVSTADRPAQL